GGFSRNQAMRDQYVTGTKVEWTNTAEGDTGDLIQEAIKAGAAIGQMREMVGQPVALPPGRPAAIAHGEVTKPHSILVDQAGQRFRSESKSYVELARGILDHYPDKPGSPAWLVVDSQFLSSYMFLGTMAGAPKPQPWIEQGFLKKADTIEGLAQACGIDPAKL